MKDIFIINARYNKNANKALAGIVNGLSEADREQDRGSYYGSLSGLVAHTLGGTCFFMGLMKEAAANNNAAMKAYENFAKVTPPGKGEKYTGDKWAKLLKDLETADQCLVDFAEALTDKDLQTQIKVPFYGGDPASVPLTYLLLNLTVHNTHHRGQASQILDAMKIDNNYSGIDKTCLPK